MKKHISNGVTHFGAKKFKCKVCKQRLTSEDYHNSTCPGKPVEDDE